MASELDRTRLDARTRALLEGPIPAPSCWRTWRVCDATIVVARPSLERQPVTRLPRHERRPDGVRTANAAAVAETHGGVDPLACPALRVRGRPD